LTLDIPSAEWTCLLGASGVGKTTLLRLLAGLNNEIEFDGLISTNDGHSLAPRVTLMAQSDMLLPWLDVLANVTLGAGLRGERKDIDRAHQVIDRVGLSPHINKKPTALSGGQKQRAALARTLMEDQPVVLLDEPFSALDAVTRAEMQELAAQVFRGRTVLLVTHDPAEAARLGHSIQIMETIGITPFAPPSGPPPRGLDDFEALAVQSRLLALLREMTE
jgi:putative hydroxymethylpyrimidine transport system ATP-binding protein